MKTCYKLKATLINEINASRKSKVKEEKGRESRGKELVASANLQGCLASVP